MRPTSALFVLSESIYGAGQEERKSVTKLKRRQCEETSGNDNEEHRDWHPTHQGSLWLNTVAPASLYPWQNPLLTSASETAHEECSPLSAK